MTQPPNQGLKNPAGAVRGVGAAALVVETVVLLLALAPLARLGDSPAALWLCGGLALLAVVLTALLRHPWVWYVALVIPAALLVGGALHWSLAALGVLFALMWGYAMHVRRTVFANAPSSDE